jgi:hypothetical protein
MPEFVEAIDFFKARLPKVVATSREGFVAIVSLMK